MRIMGALAITQRIIRQFKHDKRTLALLFVAPIVAISLLGPLLSAKSNFKVGVVNEDRPFVLSPPSKAAVDGRPGSASSPLTFARGAGGAKKAPPAIKPIKVSDVVIRALEADGSLIVTTPRESEIPSLLKKGDLVAAIKFPASFSEGVLTGKAPKVSIDVDGSNPSRAQSALARIQGAMAKQAQGSRISFDIKYAYGGNEFDALDYVAPIFIAFFAFFFVFLLTSVSFLRERGQGTIERLMSSPASRLEIILGYQLGFLIFATLQVAIIMLYTIFALKVHYTGNIGAVFLVEFLLTVVAVNMGIFFSSFAANELQVIQFIPIVITPQGLLSGIIVPIDEMPRIFQWLSKVMPLTYANEALRSIMLKGYSLSEVSFDIFFLIAFGSAMALLSAVTIRREVA